MKLTNKVSRSPPLPGIAPPHVNEAAGLLSQCNYPLLWIACCHSSDNGPAFTMSIAQSVSKALNIQWKLHCAYPPQSSGQVQRMNCTLKSTLTKLILETGENWIKLLPLALFRVKCTPYRAGFTPFGIMYGRAPCFA